MGGRVYDGVDPATFGVWGSDVVMTADEEDEAVGRLGGGGDGDRGDDVDGRRVVRSLSFRLETGRSPKNRMHLTEGRQGIQEMFKW